MKYGFVLASDSDKCLHELKAEKLRNERNRVIAFDRDIEFTQSILFVKTRTFLTRLLFSSVGATVLCRYFVVVIIHPIASYIFVIWQLRV